MGSFKDGKTSACKHPLGYGVRWLESRIYNQCVCCDFSGEIIRDGRRVRLAYATESVNLGQILIGTSEGEGLRREEACFIEHQGRIDSMSRFLRSTGRYVTERPPETNSTTGPID